jgi:hypothetical protein
LACAFSSPAAAAISSAAPRISQRHPIDLQNGRPHEVKILNATVFPEARGLFP